MAVQVGSGEKHSVNLAPWEAAAFDRLREQEPGLTLADVVRRGLEQPELDCTDTCCRGS